MADRLADTILRHLRKLAGPGPTPDTSDSQLLHRFAAHHDEAAFAALMGRHGRLVWGVCRHVLRHEHDAEDAFQATFLVLARKAAAIRKGEAVASWLHGVAYRVALKARQAAARRRERERQVPMPREASSTEVALRELQAVLDEEVQRLPEKYKAPFVLCCLEGKGRTEAAAELGWNEGTLSTRLAEARKRLQRRLTRRGVTLSAALSAAALAREAAAAVPAALLAATARGVLATAVGKSVGALSAHVITLAQQVVKAMFVMKLTVGVTLMMVLSLVVAGAGLAAWQLSGTQQPEGEQAAREAPPRAGGERVRRDLHGDPLPDGALARLGSARWRHEGEASSVAFSGDGKVLAGQARQGVRFWDTATGRLLHQFWPNGSGMFQSMDLSPDGKTVATREGGAIQLWDAATGKEVFSIPSPERQPRPVPGLGGIRFSPDGKTLLSLGGAYSRLFDAATGKELYRLSEGPTLAGAFAPDGKLLAVGASAPGVYLWDTATGQLVSVVKTDQRLAALAFSPDGKTIASAGERDTITLSEAATGKEIGRLATEGQEQYLAFTPDGQSLVSARWNNVRIWDVAGRKERFVFKDPIHFVRSLAVSPDGKTVALGTAFNVICLLDVATGKELFTEFQGHYASAYSVVFSPDGKILYSGGENQQIAWDVASGKQLRPATPAGASVLTLSPDGKLLAGTWRYKKSVRLWNAATGEALFTLPAEERDEDQRAQSVAFAPDGKRLVAVRANWRADSPDHGDLDVWESATGRLLRTTRLSARPAAVAVSPDGRTVAVGTVLGTVSLRDLETGAEIRTLQGHKYFVAAMAFSPDGRTLVGAGDRNQCALVWEVATGKEVARLEWDRRFVRSVAFSPDGWVLAMVTDTRFDLPPEPEAVPSRIHFWELATGKEFMHFEVPGSYTPSVAFAPDGRTLASSHRDGTVLVWDLAGRLCTPALTGKDLGTKVLEALWADLAGGDAGKAQQAVWTLAAVPEKAVPLFKARLKPTVEANPKRIARLLADLDSPTFAVRQAATQELEQLAEQALPAVNQALANNPSPETRLRLEAIRTTLRGGLTGEAARTVRSIQALEKIGTSEARQVLEHLATGMPTARATQEAKLALQRLARRLPATP